jgi:hypothetical protein
MSFFGKLWRGEYTLPVAFWGFYCGGLLACILVSLIIFAASRFVFYVSLAFDPTPIAVAISALLPTAYALFASVGVWRSAEPYWTSPVGMSRFWAGAARVVIIISIVNIARGLLDSI